MVASVIVSDVPGLAPLVLAVVGRIALGSFFLFTVMPLV
jgi:hypothetical protein